MSPLETKFFGYSHLYILVFVKNPKVFVVAFIINLYSPLCP